MEIKTIPLSLVISSPMNPRKTFNQEDIQELADNIQAQGLLQPVTVRPIEGTRTFAVMEGKADFHPRYELVCGERRYRAMCLLSEKWAEMDVVAPKGQTYNRFSDIPAIVRELSDEEAFDAMITENLQRKDVDPMEEAFAFGQLAEKGKSIEEIAARFGKSVRFVTERIKLNTLIPELMLAVKDEKMSISAAQIICKLSEENQKTFYSRYVNSAGFTKRVAESFVRDLFMEIEKACWYETDKEYSGGCGRSCSECHLNTANAGCLFWEMKCENAGRCTDRKKFQDKAVAYTLDALKTYDDTLLKAGEQLEAGKMVVIDNCEYVAPVYKPFRERVYDEVRKAGYEVVKVDDIFEGRCFYEANDKRLKQKIKQHKVCRCLNLFYCGGLDISEQWWYFKGGRADEETTTSTPATSSQSVEAMKLVQQRSRHKEKAIENLRTVLRTMMTNLGESKRVGELTEEEQLAFDILIFTMCGNKMLSHYGHKGFGTLKDRHFIEVVKQNRADRNKWIREFIRQKLSESEIMYNGLYEFCAGAVLEQWKPDEYRSQVHTINVQLQKKLMKNADKLRLLGYDTEGKLLQSSEIQSQEQAEIDKQFKHLKGKHPDAVILFRRGSFYESYYEDAEKVAKVLNLPVTAREGVHKVGFPVEALDTNVPKLVKAAIRVAICDK